MAKRKKDQPKKPKKQPPAKKASRPKNQKKPKFKELTGEELKAAYAKARKEFTAADLQKYTVDEPMVPFEDVIKELEEFVKRQKRKRA